MPLLISSKAERYFYLIVSLLLLFYSGYRCYNLGFTHDESISYNKIIHQNLYQIFTNNSNFVTANNHILNSLFMKYFELWLGPQEIYLRLHSFFAHIIYLLFSFLLLKNFKNPWIAAIGFLILNVNPYLLDFFSLARGYALSIAFMMMSVYYFIEFTKKESFKQIVLCLIAGLLATLANFSMVTFITSVILLFECFMLWKRYSFKQFFIKNVPVVFVALSLYALYKWPITKLIQYKELYFGGWQGLWRDTALSSIDFFLYDSRYLELFSGFLRFFLLAVIFTSFYVLVKKIKNRSISGVDYIFILFIVILVNHYAQHIIMHTNFIRERVALFLVPLFFMSTFNIWSYFWERASIKKIISSLMIYIFIIILVFVSVESLNFSYTYDWKYDADTKKAMNDVGNLQTKNVMKISNTWLYEPSINFYRQTQSLTWLVPANRDEINNNSDFYLISEEDFKTLDKSNKQIVNHYETTHLVLLKKY
ncbi:MAG: glycosyltransferase family 39 protein [Bacteroidota bacterium]